jgi:hypothetical protein
MANPRAHSGDAHVRAKHLGQPSSADQTTIERLHPGRSRRPAEATDCFGVVPAGPVGINVFTSKTTVTASVAFRLPPPPRTPVSESTNVHVDPRARC